MEMLKIPILPFSRQHFLDPMEMLNSYPDSSLSERQDFKRFYVVKVSE